MSIQLLTNVPGESSIVSFFVFDDSIKEKIHGLNVSQAKIQEIAFEFVKILPRDADLDGVVDFIFQECFPDSILILLESLSKAFSYYKFSAYDQIRKRIVEDKDHLIDNNLLKKMLRDAQLDEEGEKFLGCVDIAYRVNHPYLFALASTEVKPDEYTLNFLWINLNPQDRIKNVSKNIFGEGLETSEEELNESEQKEGDLKVVKKSILYRISKWADCHRGSQINVWFDSALVTQMAFENTKQALQSISLVKGVTLKLKDVRKLPSLNSKIEPLLHPGVQVYFRVDFLKVLITDYLMSNSSTYCIIVDMDIEPMTLAHLFDQRTLTFLTTQGYVFNKGDSISEYENSFLIFNKDKKGLRELHYKSMVGYTLTKVDRLRNYALNACSSPNLYQNSQLKLDAQDIFERYKFFFRDSGEKFGKEPRKAVVCPKSQFKFGGLGCFSKKDFQAESFRFIGESNIPYTVNGRNYPKKGEHQIESLKSWKCEPLKECD